MLPLSTLPHTLLNTVNFHDREIYSAGFAKLDSMRREGKLCDVTLIVEGYRFSAHKVVLAATIPFFNGMFLSNLAESEKNEIGIHGLDSGALEAFISYAYTGLIQITPANVQSLLIGANFLQLTNVSNICCKYISERLTVDVVLLMRNLAHSFLCTDLVSACDKFITENFEAIARTPAFLDLEAHELMSLLESDDLVVRSEECLFHIVMSWVEHPRKEKLKRDNQSSLIPTCTAASASSRVEGYNDDDSEDSIVDSTIDPHEHQTNTPTKTLFYDSDSLIDSSSSYPQTTLKSRVAYLPELLRRIRLPLVPINFISSVISKHELIRRDLRCRDLLDEVRDMLLLSEQQSKSFNCKLRRGQSGLGIIYAIGCLSDDGNSHRMVETYNPSLGRWTLAENMISQRSRFGVAALNGLLYAIGGYDGVFRLKTTEVYNPKTKTWHTVSPMSCQRSALGAAVLDDRLYVCGGYNGSISLCSCEVYHPEKDKWFMIPSMNESRSAVCLVALDGHLYAIGGHNGTTVFSSVECCNRRGRKLTPNGLAINSISWRPVANMITRRCRHGAAVLKGRIIVAGGYDGVSFLRSVEMFDPSLGPDQNGLMGQWTEISSLAVPRSRVGLAVTSRCLYAIGGVDGTTHLRTVECFQPPHMPDQAKVKSTQNNQSYWESPSTTTAATSRNRSPSFRCDSTTTPPQSRSDPNIITTTVNASTTLSSNNPFTDWRWSFSAPLIAHKGWVGVGVLPLDEDQPKSSLDNKYISKST